MTAELGTAAEAGRAAAVARENGGAVAAPCPPAPRPAPFRRLLQGHVLDRLARLPSDSVDCCVTSPPYWGLRDYGVPPVLWEGSADCEHAWDQQGFCYACSAWRGQLGLEPSLSLYLRHLLLVMREVRRVLKPTGTLWLNLGDAYNSGTRALRQPSTGSVSQWRRAGSMGDRRVRAEGLKVKDLLGMPWRAALNLQHDGWYLRSDVIWAKPNPLPEGVTDRPIRAHEHVFLLTKSPRYFYDAYAREETAATRLSVWRIPTQGYRGAHFATFPERLVEQCIRAGSSERGCCPRCRAPWRRRTQVSYLRDGRTGNGPRSIERRQESPGYWVRVEKRVETVGWDPTCNCNLDPEPAVVLDPFAGSGTTLAVAARLGRSCYGIELSAEYGRLISARLANEPALTRR